MSLTSMLRTINGLAATKLTPTGESSIEKIGNGNVVDKVSIVDKTNIRVLESETRFFTRRTRLAFAKLR